MSRPVAHLPAGLLPMASIPPAGTIVVQLGLDTFLGAGIGITLSLAAEAPGAPAIGILNCAESSCVDGISAGESVDQMTRTGMQPRTTDDSPNRPPRPGSPHAFRPVCPATARTDVR